LTTVVESNKALCFYTLISQQLPVNGAVTTNEPSTISNVSEHFEYARSRGCHDPSTKRKEKFIKSSLTS